MDIELENYHADNMDLYDTIEYMNSVIYKERFIAEYCQLKMQISKSYDIIEKYQINNTFEHDIDTFESNINTLIEQYNAILNSFRLFSNKY